MWAGPSHGRGSCGWGPSRGRGELWAGPGHGRGELWAGPGHGRGELWMDGTEPWEGLAMDWARLLEPWVE